MGSKLRAEKLGAIAHSGGNITLAPSIFNIGSRQFTTTSTLSVAVGSHGLNALRYVYLIHNAGVPALVVSANVNSVGPTGYLIWKLIAAFYTDGVDGSFGSFVTIEGTPQSDWIPFTMVVDATTTAPTKGDNIERDDAFWKANGADMDVKYSYRQIAATGANNGSGTYLFQLPLNKTVNSGVLADDNRIIGNNIPGSAGSYDGANSSTGHCKWYDDGSLEGVVLITSNATSPVTPSPISSTHDQMASAEVRYSFEASLPILGFSRTPLKDL